MPSLVPKMMHCGDYTIEVFQSLCRSGGVKTEITGEGINKLTTMQDEALCGVVQVIQAHYRAGFNIEDESYCAGIGRAISCIVSSTY